MLKSSIAFYNSPIGLLKICGTSAGIESVLFCTPEEKPEAFSTKPIYGCIEKCLQQLDEYFQGKRKNFDLTLKPQGTDFQQKVWAQLQKLDFGKTTSYGAIAKILGSANYMRAVGMANGKNPIAIIIPCHRVIGSNGTLTGYAGGLDRKKWLLEFEAAERQVALF